MHKTEMFGHWVIDEESPTGEIVCWKNNMFLSEVSSFTIATSDFPFDVSSNGQVESRYILS